MNIRARDLYTRIYTKGINGEKMRIQSGERAIKYEKKIKLGKGKIIQKEYLKLRKEQILVAYLCIVFPYHHN